MNWTYRGKRIRPNDKNLLYHFILAALLSLYLSIFLLFKQLLQNSSNELEKCKAYRCKHTLKYTLFKEQYLHCSFCLPFSNLSLLSLPN